MTSSDLVFRPTKTPNECWIFFVLKKQLKQLIN